MQMPEEFYKHQTQDQLPGKVESNQVKGPINNKYQISEDLNADRKA